MLRCLLIFGTLVLFLSTCAFAQEQTLPSTIGYGSIVRDGAHPITVKALGFTKNLKTFTSATNSTVLQVYGEEVSFAPTDYFVDGSNIPIAVSPTLNARLSKGSFGLAVGLGGQFDFVSGDDNDQWTWLSSARFDYAVFRDYAGLYVGANNLEGGVYALHCGITFNSEHLAETGWGWLTK